MELKYAQLNSFFFITMQIKNTKLLKASPKFLKFTFFWLFLTLPVGKVLSVTSTFLLSLLPPQVASVSCLGWFMGSWQNCFSMSLTHSLGVYYYMPCVRDE